MINPISMERWNIAQEAEKKAHITTSFEDSLKHYRHGYQIYFKYLEINPDLNNKSIIEIGPARVSSLFFCKNFSKAIVVEPTVYEENNFLYKKLNIELINKPAEEIEFPQVDEIWLMNILEHTINPNLIIDKCKKSCKVIKFFEPIDIRSPEEYDPCHPHAFDINFFKMHFGNCVKRYIRGTEPNFHTKDNAYGIYLT